MEKTVHEHYLQADYAGEATAEDRRWGYNADVFVLPHRDARYNDDVLLARLRGADVNIFCNELYPQWRINVSHAHARDFEHDGVNLFTMVIENPVLPMGLRPGYTELCGVVSEIYAYAHEGDAFVQGECDDGILHAEVTKCEYCVEPHAEGRYRAPKRAEMKALVGATVNIVLTPLSEEPLPREIHHPAEALDE